MIAPGTAPRCAATGSVSSATITSNPRTAIARETVLKAGSTRSRRSEACFLKDPQLLTIVAEAAASQGITQGCFRKNLSPGRKSQIRPQQLGIRPQQRRRHLQHSESHQERRAKRDARTDSRDDRSRIRRNLILKTGCLVTRNFFSAKARTKNAPSASSTSRANTSTAPIRTQANEARECRRPKKVFATREIILAGGAFNSPQLLMLSGIGDEKHLSHHGIQPRIHLPGVGRNLQDRYEITSVTQLLNPFELIKNACLVAREILASTDYVMGHSSVYSTNGIVLALIKRSNPNKTTPDLVIFGGPSSFQGLLSGLLGRRLPEKPLHLGRPQGTHQQHCRTS